MAVKEKELSIPVQTDRTGLALAEILATLTEVLAERKVVSIVVDGQKLTLSGDNEVEIECDNRTIKYDKEQGLKVIDGVFYDVL